MNTPAVLRAAARPVAALDVVLYDYREDKAPLLRHPVLPLARQATADGLTAHVERHWLHGPHVRIRLSGARGRVDAAAGRAAAALRTWAAGHPSGARVAGAELLARAEAAGRAELIAPPYEPLVPDGHGPRRAGRPDLPPRPHRARRDPAPATTCSPSACQALDSGTAFLGAHGATRRPPACDSPSPRWPRTPPRTRKD
ncbi:Putative thiopeptide-lantipeptide biosynthesis related protein OS=Streptomyces glaucescens OX=1907 GN=SGLAU_00740 PE=4 SV=1 [Streptomyces glaucescens]